MKIKIYQINQERDRNMVKFLHYEHLDNFQETKDINASIYDEVFSGDVDCGSLEDVYRQFNTNGHPLHRGHSLSVSDIVVTDGGAYYCDTVGFQKVDFDESLTQKPENLLKIVYVEPHRPPFEAEVGDDIRSLQRAVGGLIELVGNGDGTMLVCNDEGKLMGMEGNRRIRDGSTIIAGPFFIVGDDGENFRSLTESEAAEYMDRFAQPEDISQDEVESDMGFTFLSF